MDLKLLIILGYCFSGFVLLASVVLLVQNYLAKNHQSSCLYWRNIFIISDTIFQWAHHRLIDNFLTLTQIYTAGYFTLRQHGANFFHLQKLHRLKTVISKLDDSIDGASVQDILALGEATLGPKLSPFLKQLLSKEDLYTLNEFVRKGLISEGELYAFGNLLAHKLHKEALLTAEYQLERDRNKKAQLREQIAQENIEVSAIYLALISHFIKKDPRIYYRVNKAEDNQLTYEHIKKIYYLETRVGILMQMFHDTLEFRADLRHEASIGKITPNYFLAQLEKKELLNASMKEIHALPDRPVTLFELPQTIREQFFIIEMDLNTHSFAIGKITGLVYFLLRQSRIRVGFYAEKPLRLFFPLPRFKK